jgi:hypothetical protein
VKIGDIEVLPVLDGVGVEVAADILSRPRCGRPVGCHNEVADPDDLLVAVHFPGMRFGRILAAGGNRRFVAVQRRRSGAHGLPLAATICTADAGRSWLDETFFDPPQRSCRPPPRAHRRAHRAQLKPDPKPSRNKGPDPSSREQSHLRTCPRSAQIARSLEPKVTLRSSEPAA